MSHDRRYHPEEITLLTRLSTRLGQGPGLLHEVRCKPIAVVVGPGEVQWESGAGSGRDWAVWIKASDFGKRADIVHDAVIRFPAAERRKHTLTAWSDVLLVEEADCCTLKLSGNFGVGLNHLCDIQEARFRIEHDMFWRRLVREPETMARMWSWVARQNLEPPLEEPPWQGQTLPPLVADAVKWEWSRPSLTVDQMLARHHAGRPEGNPAFMPHDVAPLTAAERRMLDIIGRAQA